MIYLDTSIIISYIDEADPNHTKALKIFDKLDERRITSRLTLVELTSVYSRAGLDDPLALAIFSINKAEAEIGEVDFNKILTNALKLSRLLKLRTLDLLHITACKTLGATKFATLDKGIMAKKENIANIGIKIIETN